jgi:hypothetical protein
VSNIRFQSIRKQIKISRVTFGSGDEYTENYHSIIING